MIPSNHMPTALARPLPLSVVIPTRDRPAILARTLAALRARAGETAGLDVVVVDDGSRAPLDVRPQGDTGSFELRVLRGDPAGPAAARNRGIAAARAERVLLLGDDTPPTDGCLARHAAASGGLQGRIDWHPALEITPLMRFLAPAGPQHWFVGLADDDELPFTALLGSNYSAPRAWFVTEPFDERFRHAAFEDTELAWRFRRRGFTSRYSAAALCWHEHVYAEIEPFLTRQAMAGNAARDAVRRHAALAWWALVLPLAVDCARRVGWGALSPPSRDWDRLCRRAYLRGFFGRPADPQPGVP